MKPINGYDKLRGGYYTPSDIANFIIQWTAPKHNSTILEPSCGDGSFLAALKNAAPSCKQQNVTGIELDPDEAEKAANTAKEKARIAADEAKTAKES